MLKDKLINLGKAWFGDFSKDELKKFILLGIIFAFIVGVYWTLRALKDSLFMTMVGAEYQPRAKMLSLLVLLPLVMIYSKLVDRFPRHKLLYFLISIYTIATFMFAFLFMHPTWGLANTVASPYRIAGWAWYVFVESYGSLIVALFWAFAADTTSPESAKRGFPFALMVGQIGSFTMPLITRLGAIKLPMFGDGNVLVVLILSFLMIPIILLVKLFMKVTPKEQLVGYQAAEEKTGEKKEERTGFFEGLRLMLSKPYLLGIFGVVAFFEIITTLIDFNFKYLVQANVSGAVERSIYLGDYAFYVNLVTFLCLIFGISNIQRRLGLNVSLPLMPIIVAMYVLIFKMFPVVNILFWIMVVAKGINYALNSPSLKQLYVPTSRNVKYKAQAWIETFGSRGAKAAGAGVNDLRKTFFIPKWGKEIGTAFHISLSAYLAFGIIGIWFFVAIFLSKKYNKAVEENKVVC